jgi:predicted nucleic-acid-binding protein
LALGFVITVDTNILVRYVLQDDPVHGALASTFLEERLSEQNPGLITVVSLLEFSWLLRRTFGQSTARVADIIRTFLNASNLVIERRDMVTLALDMDGGFADALLHLSGLQAGAAGTITFDKKFARIDGVELLDG